MRRIAFVVLLLSLTAGFIGLGWSTLTTPPIGLIRALLLVCLVINAPWLALSAATGLVGFLVSRLARDPIACVLPVAPDPGPVRLRIALAVCTRNEEPEPIVARLGRLLDEADAAGAGSCITACLLSDTTDIAIAGRETEAMASLRARHGHMRVIERRRICNVGFKAGNLMEFLDSNADRFDCVLCLDADSVMTWPAVARLVAIMQADPRTAIVQTITGPDNTLSASLFSRLVQFGAAPGMRLWAIGQAWWQGRDGPYWGHNALIRVTPFRAHCRLPLLPDGTAILSHDHVEAALLQGAGWAVRVLPCSDGSSEGSPPSLPDMLARDARWAMGNLQYWHLLRARSLGRLGRAQMAQALAHYVLTPFWFALLPLSLTAIVTGDAALVPRSPLFLLLGLGYVALHAPRLLGHIDTLLDRTPPRYARNALYEVTFSALLDPIFAYRKSRMIVLALIDRRARPSWSTQARQGARLGWLAATRHFAVETTLGVTSLAIALTFGSPMAVLLCAVPLAGLLLAVPLAVLTSGSDREPVSTRVSANPIYSREDNPMSRR